MHTFISTFCRTGLEIVVSKFSAPPSVGFGSLLRPFGPFLPFLFLLFLPFLFCVEEFLLDCFAPVLLLGAGGPGLAIVLGSSLELSPGSVL